MSEIGWSKAPEGATHWDNRFFYKLGEDFSYFYTAGIWHVSAHSRDQVMAMTPKPTAWNGEGLPPAGIECELTGITTKPSVMVSAKSKDCIVDTWENGDRLEVLSHAQIADRICCVVLNPRTQQVSAINTGLIRPIKSEEDKAVEVMMNIWNQKRSYTIEAFCQALYKAGCRLPNA